MGLFARFAAVLFLSSPLALAASEPRRALELTPESLRFTYRSFDGETKFACRHRSLNETSPYDWKVECFDGDRRKGEYVAHVSLSRYARASSPELSIELLYWVTGSGLESETGSTTWFHLAKNSPLLGVSTSQTLDRGTAGLYLDIDVARALRR